MYRRVAVGPEGIEVSGFTWKQTVALLQSLGAFDKSAVAEATIGFQAPTREVASERDK